MQLQKPSLIVEQRQKLNAQMIQSLKLMAMPLFELREHIQLAIESNPALEVVSDNETLSLDTMSEEGDQQGETEALFENSSDSGYTSHYDTGDTKRMFMEGAIARPETLHDHLLWQLRLQPISEELRSVGENLIHNLDENGFHKEDPFLACGQGNRHVVATMIEMIRSFEPVGTCCTDYAESLAVQAGFHADAPPYARKIISNHLSDLEKGRYSDIQKATGITKTAVTEVADFIHKLVPFPGRAYSTEELQYVIPDLLVTIKDEEIVIVLNEEEIPVLGIAPFFGKLATRTQGDELKNKNKARLYAIDSIRDAKLFIHSIHQRNQTLLKVARAVIEAQKDFFIGGPTKLLPLTLRDIADKVQVHETTVSRIANKKYIQTEWGIFDLRYFFTNSISGTGSKGSSFSKEGVKQVIKRMIGSENTARSDKEIVDLLAQEGIRLARRTVAKYRSELDLESSFDRKKK